MAHVQTFIGLELGASQVVASNLAASAATPAKIAVPTWVIASSQEKVETPAGFSGFEVAQVNAGEFRTRGTWKASEAIAAKTGFIKLKAESKPAAERKGQLALVCGVAEKLTVVAFNVTTTAIENVTEIPNAAFIYFNGGWYNA